MDKNLFKLASYEAKDFIELNYEKDSRGRFGGIYRSYLNRALDLMLTVIGNYTYVNKNFKYKLDHGYYNESSKNYTGSLGLLHRKEIDMIFPMVIPSNILSTGFASTTVFAQGELTIGTLTKTFKYKKIPLIYNLKTFDLLSWIFLIILSILILILYNYKLINVRLINYKKRIYYKITILLICLLILRHIFLVIFPNCLSSNYIVLDKSNLVSSIKDLLEENTIVLTTTMDDTTVYLNKTSYRPYYLELSNKLKKCGPLCYLETLNRNNYAILSNFANRRLSLISTKQIMTIMATTLCWLLNENSLGDTNENKNEILFYKVPVENTQQTYSFGIASNIAKSKLEQINLFTLKLMQNHLLDVLYKLMIDHYAPIVAKIGPMFDAQNSGTMNSDNLAANFTLTFTFFNSTFYIYLGLNLIFIIIFLTLKFSRKYNKFNLIKLIHLKGI